MLFQSILGPTPSGAGCAAPLLQQAQAVRGARPQAAARLTLPGAAAALPCHPAGPEGDVQSSRGGGLVPRDPLRRVGGSQLAEQQLPSRCPRFLRGSLRSAAAARSCCGPEPRKNKRPAEQEGKAPAREKMLLAGTFPAPGQSQAPGTLSLFRGRSQTPLVPPGAGLTPPAPLCAPRGRSEQRHVAPPGSQLCPSTRIYQRCSRWRGEALNTACPGSLISSVASCRVLGPSPAGSQRQGFAVSLLPRSSPGSPVQTMLRLPAASRLPLLPALHFLQAGRGSGCASAPLRH